MIECLKTIDADHDKEQIRLQKQVEGAKTKESAIAAIEDFPARAIPAHKYFKNGKIDLKPEADYIAVMKEIVDDESVTVLELVTKKTIECVDSLFKRYPLLEKSDFIEV